MAVADLCGDAVSKIVEVVRFKKTKACSDQRTF